MSLTELIHFDKDGRVEPEGSLLKKLFLSLVIILVATLSFGVGRLTSGGERGGIKLELEEKLTTDNQLPTASRSQTANIINAVTPPSGLTAGSVVGSSKGTKYHYVHCPGAKQISEANKITFASPQHAEASGYTLAGNCRPK